MPRLLPRDRGPGDGMRLDAAVVSKIHDSMDAGYKNPARLLDGLPLDASDALTIRLAKAFLTEPEIVNRVAYAFDYARKDQGRPGPLIRDGSGFRFRWAKPGEEHTVHDVLSALNVLCTDSAALLRPISVSCAELITPPPNCLGANGQPDRAAITRVLVKAAENADGHVYQTAEFADVLAHRVLKLWTTFPQGGDPHGSRHAFPADHFWWLGVYLMSVDWREYIRRPDGLRRLPPEDFVSILAYAKRAMFGSQRVQRKTNTGVRRVPVGWASVERRLRDGTPPGALTWRLDCTIRDFDDAVLNGLRVALADPELAAKLRDIGRETVLGFPVGASLDDDEGYLPENIEALVPLPRGAGDDLTIDVDAMEVYGEAAETVTAALPQRADDHEHDRVHTRTAALLWSAGEAAWRERGRRWVGEWTRIVASAPPMPFETARHHLHERLNTARVLEPAFRAYLRKAYVFAVIPALLAVGLTALVRIALMSPLAHPVPEQLVRAVGVLPLLVLFVANAGWARARRLPVGLTPVALVSAAAALPVGVVNGFLLVGLATLPLVAFAVMGAADSVEAAPEPVARVTRRAGRGAAA